MKILKIAVQTVVLVLQVKPHNYDNYFKLCKENRAALLWAPAQRKRATMLYFANVFFLIFFMAALFSGPGERRFAKVLHVVDLECH